MARNTHAWLTFLGVLSLGVAIVALILALVFNSQVYGATGKLDRDVLILEEEIQNVTQQLEDQAQNFTQQLQNQTQNLTQQLEDHANPPITGWLGFWWEDPSFGYKSSWARFDPLTGKKLGNNIGYSPSEARQSSAFKAQFKAGAEANSIAFMLQGDRSGVNYMIRHNMALGTYNKTVLGAAPANHFRPAIMAYDPFNARYIGMASITTQSFRYGVVIIDADTGVITPLTGDTGTLAPLPQNQALDMQVIGNRIYYFERWDDAPGKGRIIWFDRDNGQYVGQSFFNGTFIPYPGTFVQTFLTDSYIYMWYQSVGYDAQNARLYMVLGEVGGGYDRNFAWIQGTDEADLMAKLESGNYDIYLTQHQPAEIINAACWIDP